MEEWGAVYDFVLSRQGWGSQCFGRASFRPIAKAYGITTCEINNNNEIEKKLKYVLNSKKPILCDVRINSDSKVNPKITSGKPIHDMSPFLERNEILKNMKFDD